MAKKNNNRRGFDLRGRNNWETMLNVTNATIGMTSTLVFTSGHLLANGVELTLEHAAPRDVAKQIHKTATKKGLNATLDSISSNRATKLATDDLYAMKDKFLGSKEQDNYPAIDEAKSTMNKKQRKAFKLLIATLVDDKGMSMKRINKVLKLAGTEEGVIALTAMA